MAVRNRAAVERAQVVEIACRAQVRVDRQLARKIADQPARREAGPLAIDAEDRRRAPRRPHEIQQQPDRRGLSRAVRAEKAVDLPALDLEREILDGDDRSVVLGQTVGADGRGAHRTPFARASSRRAAKTTSVAGLAVPSPAMTISPGSDGTANTSGATVPTIERLINRYDML